MKGRDLGRGPIGSIGLRAWGGRLALAAGSLAIAVLLAELVVSQLDPQLTRRPKAWQFDDHLGWDHIPGASGRMVTPEFDTEMAINGDGLRDREHERQAAAGVRRILIFGDSFAEGWGVELDESVSKVLEDLLRRRTERSRDGNAIEVLNFGMAGFGTDQEMLLFERKGRAYGPDLVIVLFYGNDLWNNTSKRGIGMERGYKPFYRVAEDGQLRLWGVPVRRDPYWDDGVEEPRGLPWTARLDRYLYEHWHLRVLAHKALTDPVPVRQQRGFYEGLYGTGPAAARYDRAWQLTARIIEEFQLKVRQAGAEMILVYVPAIVQIEEDNWRMKREMHGLGVGDFDLLKPNRRLRRIAADLDLPFLDLYDHFAEDASEQTLYYRDSHWNAAGHALAAARIHDFLKQLPEGNRDHP